MILFKLSVRNLLRKPLKSSLIAVVIASGTGFLFFANAILDASSAGMEASFIGSFTGHLAVGAAVEEAYGLFGNETPIVSEYEIAPPLPDSATVIDTLSSVEEVIAVAPIVTAAAQVRIDTYTEKNALFGVDPENYFSVCSDLIILSGEKGDLKKGGAFLNENMVSRFESKIGKALDHGTEIVLTSYVNGSVKLRTVRYAGMYRYPAPNEALDRVVLVDAAIARSLCNYTAGYALSGKTVPNASNNQNDDDEMFDIDSLFTEAVPLEESKETIDLAMVESALRQVDIRDALVETDDAAWSFVLARLDDPRKSISTISQLQRDLNTEDYRVLDWQVSAGTSALLLIAIRAILYVGVSIILLGSALVVMNSLVISVLERTEEIGSMRALGASITFVRLFFMMETLLITGTAALAGLFISSIFVYVVGQIGYKLDNVFLASLFGSSVIRPKIAFASLAFHFFGALLAGSIAWLYPVSLALKIQPIHAIQAE